MTKVEIAGEEYTHNRQYSLSDAPGKPYYRISVKREAGDEVKAAGAVSNYLHTRVYCWITSRINLNIKLKRHPLGALKISRLSAWIYHFACSLSRLFPLHTFFFDVEIFSICCIITQRNKNCTTDDIP